MGISNIGIVVENDYKEILYYENSFIIDINVSGKDLRATIESKLEEILEVKAFRIESVYKKIAKISISSEHDSENNILMYLVKVDMYSDNSDFIDREEVLGSITSILYRDYFIKYFIRYDKYNELVNSFINMIFPVIYITVILNIRFGIVLPFSFENFWIEVLVYIVMPTIILYKVIAPGILNFFICSRV